MTPELSRLWKGGNPQNDQGWACLLSLQWDGITDHRNFMQPRASQTLTLLNVDSDSAGGQWGLRFYHF